MPKEILLYTDLYSYSVADLVQQLNEVGNRDVVLRVCSNGGELKYGWALLTKLKELKGNKLFKNDGEANSMSAFAFCYADNAEATDVATFGFHRASYGEWYEKNSQLFTEADRQELKDKNAKLRAALEAKVDVNAFVRITGFSLDELFSLESRIEVVLTAEEALECKLIDRIIPLTPEFKNQIEARMVEIEAKFSTRKIAAKADPIIKTMTVDQLKAQFPETYKAIFAKGKKRGIELESDRVGSILAFIDADPKGVLEAVKSGKALTETQKSEFSIKAFSKKSVETLEEESAEPVTTDKGVGATKEKPEEVKAKEKAKAEFDASLKEQFNSRFNKKPV